MNRLGKMMCLASVGLVVCAWTSAWADEPPPIPVCRLGAELRSAMGFGPQVLAALGVDEQTHNAIAAAADTYSQQNRQTVEPLLTAIREARQNAFRQYELAGDTIATDQTLNDAVAALATAAGGTGSTLDNLLTTQQRALRAHVAANRILEAPLCLLDLTAQQRSDLAAAQRTRDLVLRHHKDRKNLILVKAAHEAFKTSVVTILTAEQKTQYEALLANQNQHLGEFQAREEARCAH
jgi:hypothetical protein